MFNPNVTPDSVLEAAIPYFKTRDSRVVLRSMSGIWEKTDNGYVVRICYGSTRPPRCAWFLVSSDTKSVVRMSDEEAKPYNNRTLAKRRRPQQTCVTTVDYSDICGMRLSLSFNLSSWHFDAAQVTAFAPSGLI